MLTVYNQNLHMHGVLCDGKDSYESTVKRAIELGFDSIGFSGHSYMAYSPSHSMSIEGTEEYKKEIYRLKEAYKGIIDVYCGIEFDMYSSDDLKGYEYVIGSFHYFKFGDEYVGFDRGPDEVQRVIDQYFDGDGMRYAKLYYEKLAEMPKYCPNCDIIGHMDLVAKHIESRHYFDNASAQYKRYVEDCIDALAGKVKAFEINTGGITRGYRSTPYPEPFILKALKERNCSIVISSDCHDNRYLNYGFDHCLELARECGFREVLKLTPKGFEAFPI